MNFSVVKSVSYLNSKSDETRPYHWGRVVAHEVGHLGGFGRHKYGTIMRRFIKQGSPPPSFNQKKRLFKGRKKIRE